MNNVTPFLDPNVIETYRKYKSSFNYFNGLLITIDQNKSRDLFSGCSATINPLDDDTKESILSYINSPTQDKWEVIYSRTITPSSTLWQAWILTDSNATTRRNRDRTWPCIPNGQAVTKAIREIIEVESLHFSEKVLTIKSKYEALEMQYPVLKTSKVAQTDYLKDLSDTDKKQVTAQILVLAIIQ
jgi:hypothetical protein